MKSLAEEIWLDLIRDSVAMCQRQGTEREGKSNFTSYSDVLATLYIEQKHFSFTIYIFLY